MCIIFSKHYIETNNKIIKRVIAKKLLETYQA